MLHLRSNSLSIIINKDSKNQGKDDLIIALLKLLLTFQNNKQLSLQYPYSGVFRLIIYTLIFYFRSNLSVGGVFQEITPRERLRCCIAGIQVPFIPRIAAPDNASTSSIPSAWHILVSSPKQFWRRLWEKNKKSWLPREIQRKPQPCIAQTQTLQRVTLTIKP